MDEAIPALFSRGNFDLALPALYRHARRLPCSAFQERMLDALQGVVPYRCSAINLWHPKALPSGVVASVSRGFDLPAMSRAFHQMGGAERDVLTREMLACPGRAVFLNHGDPRLAGPAMAPLRRFMRRFGIVHVLGIALPIEGSESCALVYVDRGHAFPPFDPADTRRLTDASPHLVEALMVNRLRASTKGMDELADVPMVLTLPDGWFIYPNASFIERWATLSARHPSLRIPRLPPGWLTGESAAALEGGWHTKAVAAEDGWRVELHPPPAPGPLTALTLRERQIARLYGTGRSHKEIARELAISPNTVRVHIASIFQKLKVSDRIRLRHMLAP